MVINISNLMKQISMNSMDLNFEENVDNIDLCGKSIKFLEPVKVTGRITTDGQIATFEGEAALEIETECDRCLEIFRKAMTIQINESFTNDSYSEDENEYYQMSDNKIDFTPVIIQNLHMYLPMKFICSTDCKGVVMSSETIADEFSPFAKIKDMLK